MRNQYAKAKDHLINEWVEMRQRITKLQTSEIQVEQAGEEIKKLNGNMERLLNLIGQFEASDKELENGTTEHAKEEEALRKSLAEYDAIIEAFDGLIYICSNDYKVEFMNERFIQRTGYNPIGQECYKALHNLDSICPWCVNKKVFQGETVRWEVLSPKDNRWYYIVNTPIRHPDGRISKMAMIQDITERKKIEEALRESEKRYRTIFEESRDAIYITTREGRFVDINQSGLNLFGFTKQEMIGMNVREIYVHAFDRQRFQQEIEQKGSVRDYVVKFRKKDGTEMDCLLTATVKRADDGSILGYQGIIRDITERKKAEEEIKKLDEDLKRRAIELATINKELEAFSYSVSHDLRTPLIAIGGFSHLLLEKYSTHLDEKGQQFLNIIRTKAQNMSQLIDDTLAFCHLSRREMKSSDINMGELAKAIFEELRLIHPERHLLWNIKTLPSARGDQTMIRQVFVNLLSNAIKFTKPKETAVIEIGGRVEEGRNIYYVKDNGVGFDVQEAKKLFNAFQRLHSTEEFEGTGIGLAIVHRIIQRHDGQVWAEGKVNEGAIFFFTLPR
jgi:PAS domain S-box-containing protein